MILLAKVPQMLNKYKKKKEENKLKEKKSITNYLHTVAIAPSSFVTFNDLIFVFVSTLMFNFCVHSHR